MIKSLVMWFLIIFVGFILFALTQVPFQMGFLGGYQGMNLTIIGILQAALIIPLIYFSLRYMKLDFTKIGFTSSKWKEDALLGSIVAICWALIQFIWLIPNTGGDGRADISGILTMLDHQWINILWYIPLGVIGGGLTEELYNRGFVIGAIAGIFRNSRIALYIAAIFAIIFFAAGHLPININEWVDLLVPSTVYTLLYLYTKRLTASIIAHGLWNVLAVIGIFIIYG
ncbi:CPBP family intramembrane glutamic endopeptidase [Paenisporosarcina antarctica]|uniref:CPBP family intramembrane metalloprotease n=1 Tax=Paenisporosarcina antarctica TaxID=417367 RepID=A0A4P6ZZX8_9BACL|nr:CPBP family intramembrane glutamic endopeptidase [Paenisporosarcina antarctica]QBP41913.1 CPBP family intramembrane metalloprotease [Paenisporosarcina antarctica]